MEENKIEFEGTQEEMKPEKKSWWNINTLLLLGIFLVCFFVAFYVIHYYQEFSTDPLLYGAAQYNIKNCLCLTATGIEFSFNQTTIWQFKKSATPFVNNMNWSAVQIG